MINVLIVHYHNGVYGLKGVFVGNQKKGFANEFFQKYFYHCSVMCTAFCICKTNEATCITNTTSNSSNSTYTKTKTNHSTTTALLCQGYGGQAKINLSKAICRKKNHATCSKST